MSGEAARPAPRRWLQLLADVICMAMIANLQYGSTLFVNPIDQKHHWRTAAMRKAAVREVLPEANMLERLNQEIKRRTHVVPSFRKLLASVRALVVEMHEHWLEAMRYLNMDHLREHQKRMLRQAA